MKAIKTNTDARRLLNVHYKEKCLCFKGTDVMSLVFVAVERCVFSLLFCRFLIQKFLKTIDNVIHSLIQRIFMQIVVESSNVRKNGKSHKKTISLLCKLFCLCSEFSYQNYDEHICIDLFHCSVLSLTIYFNYIMFSYHSYELSQICDP